MNIKNQTGLAAAATDNQALTHPETNQKQADPILSGINSVFGVAIRTIEAEEAAKVALDLIRGGQQHPDFLHDLLIWQIKPESIRPFLAQLQKRIQEAQR